MPEILLYGIVGNPDDGCDAASIVAAITAAGDDVTLRINSPGGLVFDGLAILNALQQVQGKVTIYIDGLAASMASVLAMAGDEVLMAENALMMIHNPMDGTYGDAAELRQTADRLDKVREQIVSVFAARTGLEPAALNAMLDAETWLTADEALAQNFVTGVTASLRMAACDVSAFGFRKVPEHPLIALAKRAPAPAAITPVKEPQMPDPIDPAAPNPAVIPPAVPPVVTQPVNVTDAVAAAIAAERTRTANIRNEVTRAGLDATFANTLVDEGVTVDVARERIIDHIATAAPQITNYRPALIPAAQFAARADAMVTAILNRANPSNQITDEARPFAGRRLNVLARDWLDATGVNTRMMTDVEVALTVFRQPRNAGMHTTSDFPSILGNTVGRTLRRGYELAPKTFPDFCRQATVPDFRPVSRVALSDISPMKPVAESGEYQYATVGDSAEQYTVGKWGQIISLTWETIVNDDLNAFDRLPMAMGQEAAQIEGDVVYAILLGNPNMADGTALFASGHGNLAPAGTAISIAALSAGRVAMRTQKAPKGRFLAIAPAFLVVGPLQESLALQYTSTNFVAAKSADINPEYNQSLKVVVDPRITDNAWFLFANPNAAAIDTIEYAYLAGAEGVMIEQRQGYEVDGLDIKARLVFGAKAIDWRGGYKNPGA
jgi:ATP-dependent Clp endopeptidase proteolytic subunit ClpP